MRKGVLKRVLVCVLSAGMVLSLGGMTAMAEETDTSATDATTGKTDSVDIYVGYFGDTYVYIDTVTEEEMEENCECGEWTYSSIDNGLYTRYTLAYGATLTSLMDYVGIDASDINIMYFTGTDEYSGKKGNYGLYNLFGVRHYYYPYLAEYWDQEKGVATEPAIVEGTYYEVPAILAFEQSSMRDSGAFDYDKYKAKMSDEQCLRLVFGQTTYNEVSASGRMYWVNQISVGLKGSPIKTSNWETKIGSSVALEDYCQIDSGYAELDELIKNGIMVTSDNSSVVQVDANNNLIAVGAGTARVNIEYIDGDSGSFSAQIVVMVANDLESTPGSPDTGSTESPSSTGSGGIVSGSSGTSSGSDSSDTSNGSGSTGSDSGSTSSGSGSGSTGSSSGSTGSGSGSGSTGSGSGSGSTGSSSGSGSTGSSSGSGSTGSSSSSSVSSAKTADSATPYLYLSLILIAGVAIVTISIRRRTAR